MFITKLMFSVVIGAVNLKYLFSCRESLSFHLWGVGGGEGAQGEENQSVTLDLSKDPGINIMYLGEERFRDLHVHVLLVV